MSLIALRAVASISSFDDFRPADLAGDDDAVGGRQRLAGDADLTGIDARLRAFAEEQIDDLVGDAVADLVRMTFGHGFAGELVILTSHIDDSPAEAPVAATLRGLTDVAGRAGAAFASGRSVRQAEFGRIVRFTERANCRCRRPPIASEIDQINDPAAHLGVRDAQKGAIELQALGRGEEVDDVGLLRRCFGKPSLCRLRGARLRRNTLAGLRAPARSAGADWRRSDSSLFRISGPAGTSRREARRACSGSCPASSGASATARRRTRRQCWMILTSTSRPAVGRATSASLCAGIN